MLLSNAVSGYFYAMTDFCRELQPAASMQIHMYPYYVLSNVLGLKMFTSSYRK